MYDIKRVLYKYVIIIITTQMPFWQLRHNRRTCNNLHILIDENDEMHFFCNQLPVQWDVVATFIGIIVNCKVYGSVICKQANLGLKMDQGKSLMLRRKSKGPRTDHCTPDVTGTSDDSSPIWYNRLRKHFIHESVALSTPCSCNLKSNLRSLTLSKKHCYNQVN